MKLILCAFVLSVILLVAVSARVSPNNIQFKLKTTSGLKRFFELIGDRKNRAIVWSPIGRNRRNRKRIGSLRGVASMIRETVRLPSSISDLEYAIHQMLYELAHFNVQPPSHKHTHSVLPDFRILY